MTVSVRFKNGLVGHGHTYSTHQVWRCRWRRHDSYKAWRMATEWPFRKKRS